MQKVVERWVATFSFCETSFSWSVLKANMFSVIFHSFSLDNHQIKRNFSDLDRLGSGYYSNLWINITYPYLPAGWCLLSNYQEIKSTMSNLNKISILSYMIHKQTFSMNLNLMQVPFFELFWFLNNLCLHLSLH